jgi:ubiquinone/menaquinone biosynthesis C-methylase UbiE
MSVDSRHAELNKEKWDKRSVTYDEKRFDYFRFMQKRVLSLMDLAEMQNFLDIGCGTGWAVCHAAGLIKEGGLAWGIDISPGMVEKATENARGLENARFAVANAEKLPFDHDFFDGILCTNSFHHYLDPSTVLDGIRHVLRPGGKVFILDFTADGPVSRAVDGMFRRREPEHVKFYSTREYRQFFKRSGLLHLASRVILPPMKVHIATKPTGPAK